MLTLFHSPDSRSSRFIWLLEELGAAYELAYVDIVRGSGGRADAAFPQAGLGAPVGDPRRGAYLSWLTFYAGEIEMAFNMLRRGWLDKDPRQALAKDHERVQSRVLAALGQGSYLTGTQFTAADILVASPYQWLRDFGPPSTLIDDWLARLADRPAAIRAAALDQPAS
jgi:glutathione S-transferase